MIMSVLAVEMPKWGMTMEEGLVASWLVSEGDAVTADQPVVEVESSKIAGELTAPGDGVLVRVLAREGDELPVGTLLGVIAAPGTPGPEIDVFIAAHGGAPSGPGTSPAGSAVADDAAQPVPVPAIPAGPLPAPPAAAAAPAASAGPPAASTPPAPAAPGAAAAGGSAVVPDSLKGADTQAVPATPHAADLAAAHGIALGRVPATGRGGRVTVADLQRAVAAAGGSLPFGNDRRRASETFSQRDDSDVPATPHARDLAASAGANLHDARPTGRGGRVTVADVEALIARRAAAHGAPAPTPAPTIGTGVPAAPAERDANAFSEVPMSRMRTIIGQRLHASYSESPHFRVTVRARVDALLGMRRQINEGRRDVRVSVNDLVVAAAARALVVVPEVNAQYDPDARTIRRFEHADVAVAVSTAEGLITPIVTHADTRTITDISAQVHDLATRAKAGTLTPDEFQGGTFTVSNLGMFGVSQFDAIINPPQVAILAVGATSREFVPDDDGAPVAASLLPLTLSADHRVVDGALAARFCAELVRLLESPALIVV